MVRNVDDLIKRVLNTYLQKSTKYGILGRITYNEVPADAEYKDNEFGTKLLHRLKEPEKASD